MTPNKNTKKQPASAKKTAKTPRANPRPKVTEAQRRDLAPNFGPNTDRLIAKNLSREDWTVVSEVFNPFSDYRVRAAQIPDRYGGASTIRRVRYDQTVNVQAGGELMISTLPLGLYSRFSSCCLNTTGDVPIIEGSNAWSIPTDARADDYLGPINVTTVTAAGAPHWPSTAAFTETATCNPNLPPAALDPVNFSVGQKVRLFAGGFQIVNETVASDAGGDITTVGFEQEVSQDAMAVTDSSTSSASAPVLSSGGKVYLGTVLQGDLPAPNQTAMFAGDPDGPSIPATRGIYVPLRFDHLNNPPQFPKSTPILFRGATIANANVGSAGYVSTLAGPPISASGIRYVNATSVTSSFPAAAGARDVNFIAPIECTQTLVSSLPKASTFKIRIVLFYEVWQSPGVADSTISYEIRPRYRPELLSLLAKLTATMDIAVPQDMNPSGEAWASFIHKVNQYLPGAAAALSAVFPEAAPVIEGIASAAQVAESLTDRVMALRKAYRK